jgi:mannose/cellobiose epimerase-like protein (N-acyl-D-glucosamine 2-epimerase family)
VTDPSTIPDGRLLDVNELEGGYVDAECRRLLVFAREGALPGLGFGWLDERGCVDRSQGVHTWVTARMTHVFALASLRREPGALNLAAGGVQSLLSGPLRDSSHGGWLGRVDMNGRPVDDRKLAYDHAFAILAGCSALTAEVPRAEVLLDEAVTVFERRFLDSAGRVIDGYPRDFSEPGHYRGANSSMHTVEALLALGDVRADPAWHHVALTIAEHLVGRVTEAFGDRLPEHYDVDWTPLPEYNVDHKEDPFRPYGVTPGHLLEWSRLLLQLEATLDDPPSWLFSKAQRLFAVAVEIGWSVDGRPGFVYTTDWEDHPVVRNRMHWVHAEAVAAAAALAARTDAAEYSTWVSAWWYFIGEHFMVAHPGSGENWYHELDGENHPTSQVWSGKPDVYHAYQALLLDRHRVGRSLAERLSTG